MADEIVPQLNERQLFDEFVDKLFFPSVDDPTGAVSVWSKYRWTEYRYRIMMGALMAIAPGVDLKAYIEEENKAHVEAHGEPLPELEEFRSHAAWLQKHFDYAREAPENVYPEVVMPVEGDNKENP